MSTRISFWLAWFAWVLYLVITLLTELLTLKNASAELLSDSFNALVLLVFITVGAFIASRRPENPIGWIICIGTLIWALSFLALEYGIYGLITAPGSLPGGALVSLFGAVARGIGWYLIMTFLLLLFPNGHLPSSRWRPLAWLIAGLLAAYMITLLLDPNPFINVDTRLAPVRNPLGIAGASDLFDQFNSLILLVLLATVVACIASVIVRFRRARGDERQQLKWLAYGTLLSLLIVVAIVVSMFANVETGPLSSLLFYLPVLSITISASIAILRYRLYTIDILINRTLVYGALTALLALIYFGLVFILQSLVRALGGQFSQTPLVIVGSTLVIAALFQPLRRRIQQVIDRRFYRRKYDATKTVQAFSATLRSEVDLSQLREHLITVVQETMQPTQVSLWLRPPEHGGNEHTPWRATPPVSSEGR
ncbi:MAG TPA: hypothetical protein DDW25_05010 [Ktedonobacter sp.]|jgi:hypothetical protein|nr:hypothetical protein [Ktedonobacter sp.]